MSTTTEPSTEPTTTPIKEKRRCRSLTVDGLQCNSTALRGHDFCHTHLHYRHPECPMRGLKIVMPLLEDHSSIQLVLSQAAHGVFTGLIDNRDARTLAFICQVAALTLPRPTTPRAMPLDKPKPVQQPVADVVETPDGELLGPDEPWRAPDAATPVWSFDKYLLDEYSQKINQPLVTRPEDLPPSGWLTEDEIKERHDDTLGFLHDFRDRIRDARTQLDIRGQLPPLATRPCGFGNLGCNGQQSKTPCKECLRERDQHAARAAADPFAPPESTQNQNEAAPGPDPATLDLNATAAPSPEHCPERCTLNAERCSEPCNLSPVTCSSGGDIKFDNIPHPCDSSNMPHPHTQGAPRMAVRAGA